MKSFWIVLLISISQIFGQGNASTPLETQQLFIQQQIRQLTAQSDSLLVKLNYLQKSIDVLQSRMKSKKKTIALQKQALTLSQKLVRLQSRVKNLQQKLKQLNQQLFTYYSRQLDSLKTQAKSESTPAKKELLLKKITVITQKRLMVLPLMPNLSFDPQKISKIHLKGIRDSLKKAMAREYVQNALNNVNTLMQNLQIKRNELTRMALLRKKADHFLNEIDDNQLSAPMPYEHTTNSAQPLGIRETNRINAQTSINTILIDLPQINRLINHGFQGRQKASIDSIIAKIKWTQQALQAYRRYLKSKLQQ